ncbi:MAG: hypothetical protein E7256_13595 [Lachnospiraceae bacterium]|nr:hypothetical protein [Lachnospiraceae bacterium]
MSQLNKGRKKKKPLICNMCGRRLHVEKGLLLEDACEVTKEWGYFSTRDLEIHHFTLCEECYNKFISSFKVPVDVIPKNEAM